MNNPYQAPQAQGGPGSIGGGEGCPRCNAQNVVAPRFTWWGGALGPKVLNHRVCKSCGFGFNAKTRQSNTTGIVIYSLIASAIAFTAVWLVTQSR